MWTELISSINNEHICFELIKVSSKTTKKSWYVWVSAGLRANRHFRICCCQLNIPSQWWWGERSGDWHINRPSAIGSSQPPPWQDQSDWGLTLMSLEIRTAVAEGPASRRWASACPRDTDREGEVYICSLRRGGEVWRSIPARCKTGGRRFYRQCRLRAPEQALDSNIRGRFRRVNEHKQEGENPKGKCTFIDIYLSDILPRR